MDPVKIYDYLIKTREKMFDAVRSLTPQQHQRSFPFGLKTIASTLTHIMVSEWYYIERVESRHVEPYEKWPIKYENPPAFDSLESTWRKQAQDVRKSIAAQRDWNRKISWSSFPNDEGKRFRVTCTAGDLVTQLALHEVHHRAQVMAMLRDLPGGKPLEDLDYNALMFERRALT